jgi:hypothetical protein
MFFGGVIKNAKIEKTGFSSYFVPNEKSSSYQASYSYKAFGKNRVPENVFIELSFTG